MSHYVNGCKKSILVKKCRDLKVRKVFSYFKGGKEASVAISVKKEEMR